MQLGHTYGTGADNSPAQSDYKVKSNYHHSDNPVDRLNRNKLLKSQFNPNPRWENK